MTMPLSGLTPVGIGPVTDLTGIAPGAPAAGGDNGFAGVLASSLDALQAKQSVSNDLAVKASTGDLKDVHDYMIASAESGVATEMVVTIKNQAVAAFNEIMRMQI